MKKSCLCLLLPLLAACSSMSGTEGGVVSLLHPYRIDVRQGNFVTQEMVAQLKPGQTKDQVRFILGTPLLTDIFHADRWDYVYRLQTGIGDVQQRRLAVFFQNGKLSRLDGDVVADAAAAKDAPPKAATHVIDIKAPAPEAAPAGDAEAPVAPTNPQ